jgi:hypothetical protein
MSDLTNFTAGSFDNDNIVKLRRALSPSTLAVSASRVLTDEDNGLTLECTVATLSLTVPATLKANFGCAIIPNGTTSIVSSGGVLLNGAVTTLTRADSANALFAIVPRSVANSYVVTGV